MSRARQWPVGDGGLRGTRVVHVEGKEGRFVWQGHIYRSEKLAAFGDQVVFIEDFCGPLDVSECLWTMHHFSREGSPYAGRIICQFE